MSTIFEAVEWVVDKGAKVVNMSFGSPIFNSAGDALMEAAYNDGSLLVAASGNDGTNGTEYPGGYAKVLSVGAVDQSRKRAAFSQFNSDVDVVAPGVNVLSTFPLGLGGLLFVTSDSVGVASSLLKYSTALNRTQSGILVDCPNYGNETCPGGGGHICLIRRCVQTSRQLPRNVDFLALTLHLSSTQRRQL